MYKCMHMHTETHKLTKTDRETDTHIHTHAYTHVHAHTHVHTRTHNTYLHLRTRDCYSTDDIGANGLYHVIELLNLNICHLSDLCDLKFILFPDIFSLSFYGCCQPLQF